MLIFAVKTSDFAAIFSDNGLFFERITTAAGILPDSA